MMRTLLVLRHAKSSWDQPGLEDHARPLSPRGERDAPRMGRFLRDARIDPDLIISSDAARARQTAEAAAAAAGFEGTILLDPRLYHAGVHEIVAVLRELDEEDDAATVMIVGHNPGFEELVGRLTGERETLPTAALARIDLPIDEWSDLEETTRGTLAGLWRPKTLP
jgi:phosphohistidine phosphatase